MDRKRSEQFADHRRDRRGRRSSRAVRLVSPTDCRPIRRIDRCVDRGRIEVEGRAPLRIEPSHSADRTEARRRREIRTIRDGESMGAGTGGEDLRDAVRPKQTNRYVPPSGHLGTTFRSNTAFSRCSERPPVPRSRVHRPPAGDDEHAAGVTSSPTSAEREPRSAAPRAARRAGGVGVEPETPATPNISRSERGGTPRSCGRCRRMRSKSTNRLARRRPLTRRGGIHWGERMPPQQRWIGGNH